MFICIAGVQPRGISGIFATRPHEVVIKTQRPTVADQTLRQHVRPRANNTGGMATSLLPT